LNATLTHEQLSELICTVDTDIFQNIRRIGDFVKQFNGAAVVVREPVGELLEDRSNQGRTDVLGQMNFLSRYTKILRVSSETPSRTNSAVRAIPAVQSR